MATLIIEHVRHQDVSDIFRKECLATDFGWSEKNILDSLDTGNQCYKLGCDELIIGYCIVRLTGTELEILNIVIFKGHQGQGYGSYLLEKIIDSEEFSAVDKIWLEVRIDNIAAQALYTKLGFCIAGKRSGYYTTAGDGKNVDALVMRR